MKLTKQEYDSLFDSRLVDVKDALARVSSYVVLCKHEDNLKMLDTLIERAEKLKEAYEAYVEAEENEQIEEAKKDNELRYGINMTVGLNEALSIRKGE